MRSGYILMNGEKLKVLKGERVTIDYINKYVKEQFRVDIKKPFRPTRMTKDQAKKLTLSSIKELLLRRIKCLKI